VSNLKLAFLHIPKTAGTSLRQKMNHSYGRENVFWIGVDCEASTTEYPAELVAGSSVIGGHRGISFYPADIAPIFCSVLRDPVQRAVSLFAYYTRPDLAETEGQVEERRRQLERMLEVGIKPDSLLLSLEQCEPFRHAVSDQQCRFLSRGAATFTDAREALEDHDFLVGTHARYDDFFAKMSGMLHWKAGAAARLNKGREDYAREYQDDSRAEQLIRELNGEDYQLLEYIEQKHDSLYCNLRNPLEDSRLLALSRELRGPQDGRQ